MEHGVYVGNVSLSDLCQFVKLKKRFGTKRVMAQLGLLKEDVEKRGYGTNGA